MPLLLPTRGVHNHLANDLNTSAVLCMALFSVRTWDKTSIHKKQKVPQIFSMCVKDTPSLAEQLYILNGQYVSTSVIRCA